MTLRSKGGIAYEERGSGAAFVALHGHSLDRRIYPDLPFMGESTDEPEGEGHDGMLAERYPRASYHVLDGAGHNAQIEAPEAFATAFKTWLADCEATNYKRPSS